MLNGSMTTVDEMLDKFAEALAEANPDPETWGTSAQAEAGLKAATELFPQAAPRSDPPAEPTMPG